MTDMQDLITSIGSHERELANYENDLKAIEPKLKSVRTNRTAGGVALLVCILGALVLTNLWPLWLFLGLAGLLTYITAMGKLPQLEKDQALLTTQITESRGRLAEIKARLSVAAQK